MVAVAAAREQARQPSPIAGSRRWREGALIGIALALPALVYFPITGNYFVYDDFLHLYHIVNESWLQFFLTMHGGHLLMLRNAVFALCYTLFGTDTVPYFWLVLVTHLLNVFLLFRIVRQLTDSPELACFGAALWGILPSHVQTLGWYSVYGQVMATTFTLLVLLALVGAAHGRTPSRWAPLGWVLLLIAAATSFGVGIGAACAMPIAAWLLLPASGPRLRSVVPLAVLAAAMPFIYFGLEHVAVALYGEEPASTYLGGGLYLQTQVRLVLALLGSGVLALVYGPFEQIRKEPGAAALAAIAVYVALLLAALVVGNAALRRRIAACVVLAAGAYAVISVGRGLFTASRSFWWFAQTPRYQYFGTAPLAIVTCLLLGEIGGRWRLPAAAKTGLLLAWASAIVLAHLAFGRPIDHSDDARREIAWIVGEVSYAMHQNCRGNDVYIENANFRSFGGPYLNRHDVFPGWAAVFAIYFPDDVLAGRRIRFVEDDPYALELAQTGRRTATLMVSREEAGDDVYQPPERRRRHRSPVHCR